MRSEGSRFTLGFGGGGAFDYRSQPSACMASPVATQNMTSADVLCGHRLVNRASGVSRTASHVRFA